MKKITINSLTIELTRRCNTVCPHCMRGLSQNIDIDDESIDSILKQTDIINYLNFTGGEPTLCVDKMRYILKKLIEYRIPVFNFQITTNGYLFNGDIISVIKDYSKLITMCRSIGCKYDTLPHYMNCLFLVSTDKYHYKKEKQERNFKRYEELLNGYAQVKKSRSGNLCLKKGFAKHLANATKVEPDNSIKMKKIEIMDKYHTLICPLSKSFKLIDDEQIQIICPLQLTVYGNLIPLELADDEYDIIDSLEAICNVKESDIYESILSYNASRVRCHKLIEAEKQKPVSYPNYKDTLSFIDNYISAYPIGEAEIIKINQSDGNVWSNVGGLLSKSGLQEQNGQQQITAINKIKPLRNDK